MVLNTHSRRLFGKELEALTPEEFHTLVSTVMPGREKLLERIFVEQEIEDARISSRALEREGLAKRIALFI